MPRDVRSEIFPRLAVCRDRATLRLRALSIASSRGADKIGYGFVPDTDRKIGSILIQSTNMDATMGMLYVSRLAPRLSGDPGPRGRSRLLITAALPRVRLKDAPGCSAGDVVDAEGLARDLACRFVLHEPFEATSPDESIAAHQQNVAQFGEAIPASPQSRYLHDLYRGLVRFAVESA